jgi:GrpB-like predicted nucleotidyltransferase (UPF0157 family)
MHGLTLFNGHAHTGNMGREDYRHEELAQRSAEVAAVATRVATWASEQANVRAAAMVGSWARGEGRLDSDLDIVLLAARPDRLTASEGWLAAFGSPPLIGSEHFGVISERRVRLGSGLELEFGIGPLKWASTTPLDPGTRRVVQDGLWVLFDPDGRLAGLRQAVSGDEDEPIRIVPYDPSWPARFEQEKALAEHAIATWVTGGVHHVGSTAVPGLDAKPVIDILVGVESLSASRACFGPLSALGYAHAPYRPDEMHWFCKPSPSHRTHHLHLVPTGSTRYHDELAFRDALRADHALATEYRDLKRALAIEHEHDREAYTEAKGAFIGRVVLAADGQ